MVTAVSPGQTAGAPGPGSRCVCPPQVATERDPSRPTLGGRVAQVAEQLGTPLMPWQRLVADVALEVDPETGRLAYREVDLTVPRQQGKTTLELAVMVDRARAWARSRILYSAQDRIHARSKWEDEHVATLQRSPMAGEFTVRYQRGDEAIRWRNGSRHGITAPNEKAGHSEVLDLAMVDEAWAHEDASLEQGVSPTMITRPQPQLWVVSTAGTRRSGYLRGKVERGRARVAAGRPGRVAYFEWAAPLDSDPADPATWRACMPALGHTITEATIADEFDRLELAEFCRAYLNWWPSDVPDDWQVIAREVWAALADPGSRMVDPVALPPT
jgi:phage terminase large subunit-like protein